MQQSLINKWKNVPKDERFRFYEENLFHDVSQRLRDEIKNKQLKGEVDDYRSLIGVIGHNPHPFLLVAAAINPENVTMLYEPDKRVIADRSESLLRHEGIAEVNRVELDQTSSEKNGRIIRKTVKKNKRAYKNILCDVTSGKNILAAEIGIASYLYKIEICYLEGIRSFNGTPEPGWEALYIGNKDVISRPFDRLKIGYDEIEGKSVIKYDLLLENKSFEIGNLSINEELKKMITDKVNFIQERCNNNIEYDPIKLNDNLREFSRFMQRMLVPQKFNSIMKKHSPDRLNLVLDAGICAFPWEVFLNHNFGVELPVFRTVHRKDDSYELDNLDSEDLKIIVIFGSGSGIEKYDSFTNDIKNACFKFRGVNFIYASNHDELRLKLSPIHIDIILYFGHAQYYSDSNSSGWECLDGSIFTLSEMTHLFSSEPPQVIIASACQTARSTPFLENSIAHSLLSTGIRTYIGSNWLLEAERSKVFITSMVDQLVEKKLGPTSAFTETLNIMRKNFGDDDISLFTYIYYGY